MSGAGEALGHAARAAVARIGGLAGAYDGAPVQASLPYATIEAGPESDWGHKSGDGREVRLAVVVRDAGEQPARLRRLMGEAETALGAIDGVIDGWRVVTMRFLRGRVAREGRPSRGSGQAWVGVSEISGADDAGVGVEIACPHPPIRLR